MKYVLAILTVGLMLASDAPAASSSRVVNCTLTIQASIVVTCDPTRTVTVTDGGAGGTASLNVNVQVTSNIPVTVSTGLSSLPGGLTGVTQTATRSAGLTGTLSSGTTNGSVTVTWSGLGLGIAPNTYTNTLTITVAST